MSVDIAVLGLGVMGRQHLRVLSVIPDVTVVAACDTSEEARLSVGAHGDFALIEDWHDVLALGVDGVVNAFPTGMHYEVTRAFLKAGIHVLVEKPIATTVTEARELVQLAESAGRVLMVGHIERFNPTVDIVRKVVHDGRLGKVVSASARRVGVARPTVPNANVALDLAIHDIDVLSYVLDQDGRLLVAAGSTIATNQLEDHVDIVIKYGDAIASLQANWITPVKIRRLSLTGTAGYLEADYIQQSIRLFESAPGLIRGTPWDFFAVSNESEPVELPVPKEEPLRIELEHFLQCVRGYTSPISDGRSATKALALAIEATSAARGVGNRA